MSSLEPFATTMVGSFPHVTPEQQSDLCRRLEQLDVPVWPQLPRRSFRECFVDR